MTLLQDFFDIHQIFFTFHDYQLSYLEFFGTLLNLVGVYLAAKNQIFNWPVCLVGVFLFAFLFYQIHLFGDFFQQVCFFCTGFYGWWTWYYLQNQNSTRDTMPISWQSPLGRRVCWSIIGSGTLVLGSVMKNAHTWMPHLFPLPALYPFTDAFLAITSLVANLLMAHKYMESWILWLIVDVISVTLYAAKGVVFISVLFGLFFILSLLGMWYWRKVMIMKVTEQKKELCQS